MRALYLLLRQLENIEGTGIACVRGVQGNDVGRVMVSHGRLCYAATPDLQRVGQILVAADPAFDRLVALAVEQASTEGRRLCEVLLAQGVEHLPALREGLRRQIVLALNGMLARDGAPRVLEFVPARDDYDLRLTFTPFDVLLALRREQGAARADNATLFFESCRGHAGAALLLQRSESTALPVPLAADGFDDLRLEQLVRLARAAEAACVGGAVGRPRLVARIGIKVAWVGVVSPGHLALVRSGPALSATHLLSLALRAVNTSPQPGAH